MSKKEKKKEKAAEPSKAEAEQQKPQVPKVPKEREPLRMFFTILLVLVGIGELSLCGYLGFSASRNIRSRQAYEDRQAEASGSSRPSDRISYAGPWRTIENGVVVWEREDDSASGGTVASGQLPSGEDGEKRLSRLSVLQRHYALAEMDGGSDEAVPSEPVPPVTSPDDPATTL